MNAFSDPVQNAIAAAMKAALPTNRHAQMAVDEILAALGDRAVVETANRGSFGTVFVRESVGSELIIPWPIVRYSRGRRLDFIMGQGPPTDALPPQRGGDAPKLAGLAGGAVAFSDGVSRFELVYGDDGLIAECAIGHSVAAFAPIVDAVAKGRGNAVEALVDLVMRFNCGAAGPGRVLRPVPCDCGVDRAFQVATDAIRDRSFSGELDEATSWFAADGLVGKAFGEGASREAAAADCRRQIEVLRPKIPPPSPPPEVPPSLRETLGLPGGPFLLQAPINDAPPAGGDPAHTPFAFCELPPPSPPPPFGQWFRAVDGFGRGVCLLRRIDPHGCTVAGPATFVGLDPRDLDALLDEAVRDYEGLLAHFPPSRSWPEELPPLTSTTWTFQRVEDVDGRPRFSVLGTGGAYGFQGRQIHPEALVSGVVRQRNRAQ